MAVAEMLLAKTRAMAHMFALNLKMIFIG